MPLSVPQSAVRCMSAHPWQSPSSAQACDEAIVVVAPRSLSSGAELPIDEVVVLLGDPDGGPMVAHAVDPLEYSVFPYLPDPVAVDSVTEKVASTALRKLAPASFDDL
eukprot:Sspe_Gene.70430::Locus_41578_Transcript_1_3_Confidence_0.667_Length_506::g.70430::m.70430